SKGRGGLFWGFREPRSTLQDRKLSCRRKLGLFDALPSAVERSLRQEVDDHLKNRRTAGIEHNVLPASGAGGDEGLVDLVRRSGDDGHQHAKQRPIPAPEIA